MSIEQDVLARAAKRITYYAPDDPLPGSEAGRYWAQKTGWKGLAGPSVEIWWCMLFVSMCLDECGQINAINGFTASTQTCLDRNRHRTVSLSEARPGDVVLFNWDGGRTDHVGFVERNLGNGWLQTIEGNTSSGRAGSQRAGNGVWRRRRKAGIQAVIRPAYTGATAPSHPKVVSSTGNIEEDGWFGPNTIRKLQRSLNTNVDGVISAQWVGNKKYVPSASGGWEFKEGAAASGSMVIAALQRHIGADPDGHFGPNTIRKLQAKLGVPVDSYCGPQTTKALQRKLNSGGFKN